MTTKVELKNQEGSHNSLRVLVQRKKYNYDAKTFGPWETTTEHILAPGEEPSEVQYVYDDRRLIIEEVPIKR